MARLTKGERVRVQLRVDRGTFLTLRDVAHYRNPHRPEPMNEVIGDALVAYLSSPEVREKVAEAKAQRARMSRLDEVAPAGRAGGPVVEGHRRAPRVPPACA
jgi:hypothetical protein